ncbi:MAG: hypothetical protein JXA33_25960 [Anaerolineae bacterium]|nr:hypothetical protein [Anaerolineae bacterium]
MVVVTLATLPWPLQIPTRPPPHLIPQGNINADHIVNAQNLVILGDNFGLSSC